MTKKELSIAEQISHRIKQHDPSAEVFLFGSRARGEAKEESDWDILILIDKPKLNRTIEDKYRDKIFQLQLELGEAISTFIYLKRDWETRFIHTPFYLNIKEEGLKLA